MEYMVNSHVSQMRLHRLVDCVREAQADWKRTCTLALSAQSRRLGKKMLQLMAESVARRDKTASLAALSISIKLIRRNLLLPSVKVASCYK